ncbi:MAG TPA: universal stress protein [bacterium]|nr:universal stress protein [bacterium]
MVPSLKRVLMVTDFSATAAAALPYAYALVDPGAEVHLVHLIEHEQVPNPLYAHYTSDDLATPQDRDRAIKEVERHLMTLVPNQAQEKHITTVVGCVLHPEVAEGIIEEARKRKPDAIVMGSHGRTGLKHLLMGSVAEHVLRGCGVPVLIVPHAG